MLSGCCALEGVGDPGHAADELSVGRGDATTVPAAITHSTRRVLKVLAGAERPVTGEEAAKPLDGAGVGATLCDECKKDTLSTGRNSQ